MTQVWFLVNQKLIIVQPINLLLTLASRELHRSGRAHYGYGENYMPSRYFVNSKILIILLQYGF